jgi:mRNA interferase HigB
MMTRGATPSAWDDLLFFPMFSLFQIPFLNWTTSDEPGRIVPRKRRSTTIAFTRAASICGTRSFLTASHIVKYHQAVHLVTRKHLSEAMQEFPDAANEIKAWVVIVEGVRWHNFAEVRLMFRDADYIDGYVVFNIRRNRFRLITVIHYAKTTDEKRTEGHVYIRSFLTHKEYNDPRKWDRRFGAK